jgi:DNA-binding MarR family transcriptional regulator
MQQKQVKIFIEDDNMTSNLREIGMIARALDSISNLEFKAIDLTKGQYLYLARIAENPGIIQEELSEMIMVDRTTVARAVKKLLADGMVVKRDSAENLKIKHLEVTDKGRELYDVIKRENDYSEKVALQGFTADEVQTLNGLLHRMRENVASDWNAVKKGHQREY